MITKISIACIFPMLILALFLSLGGVTQVGYGDSYLNYFRTVVADYDSWKFEIPSIPSIPRLSNASAGSNIIILGAIINVINVLVTFFNGVISVLNIVITIVNVVIKMLQFCLTMIWDLRNVVNFFPST